MRIHFVVRNDLVFGLKFVNNVYKAFAKGTHIVTKLIRMRIKWVPSRLKRMVMCSTCLGLRRPRDF